MPKIKLNISSCQFLFTFVEKILLLIISLATIAAIIIELKHIYISKNVLLSDLLLLFLYLEIFTMVHLYISEGRVPVRYPIYIAIIALSRYITLAMKELDGSTLIWISLSLFILVTATFLLRIGHYFFPHKPINQDLKEKSFE